MAETGWTKSLPTDDGYYWLRFGSDDKNPMPVRYDSGYLHEIGVADDMRWLHDADSAEFLPASPSDFEQLTRLREAARNADEALQLIQGFDFALDNSAHGQEIRRRAIAAIDGLREALVQRNTGGK